MVWKSNISDIDNDFPLEEVSSPKVMNKENHVEEVNKASVTVDARSSDNYLQNDDVIEV